MIVNNNLEEQRKALTALAGQLSVLSIKATPADIDTILDIGADIELVAHSMKYDVPVTIGEDVDESKT